MSQSQDTETVLEFPDLEERESLRAEKYNATIIDRIDITADLARFRIRPDQPVTPFQPGQFVAIGLGNWEPRLRGTQAEDVPVAKARNIVRRAYSISCPMIDTTTDQLMPVNNLDYLEFYITLVRNAATSASRPPALTPRLFGKQTGDRVVLESRITGKYVTGSVDPAHSIVMLATGTGEAPHNAMATELLNNGHRGRVVNATSLRYRRDAGYQAEHQRLMERFPNYVYLPLTTREPENLDSNRADFVGKAYLQSLWSSGRLSDLAGDSLSPDSTQVFLCGNPDMIGYRSPSATETSPPGMLPLLRASGFHDDDGTENPGRVRFEKYW
ncbi:MAG: ferredoxin--NADP reductase [Planctomycetota bacterium]